MPDTAAGCKLVTSTVITGHTLLLLVAVGTTRLGIALTLTVTLEPVLLQVPLTQTP